MAGPLARYAFVNAKLRARISKLLPEATIGSLIRASSLVEAMQILKGTDFGEAEAAYTATGDLKMAELSLLERELGQFTEVRRHLSGPPRDLVTALSARFEVETLKNILSLWFDRVIRERDIEVRSGYLLRRKVIHELNVDALVGASDLDSFANALGKTPYAAIVREHGRAVATDKSLFPIEVALDKYYYRQLLDAVEKLEGVDRAIASRLIGVEIDMANIGWVVRLKSFYDLPVEQALSAIIPNGRNVDDRMIRSAYASQNVREILDAALRASYPGLRGLLSAEAVDSASRLALVERVLAEIMMYEVRHVLGGYPFTIGIVLAYFILKENEIRRIVTILNAKYYNATEERIAKVI